MSCCDHAAAPASRRKFLQTIALGGGATLLSTVPLFALAAGHEVDALLLTCMDYRLEASILAYMDERGLRENYDHVAIAGASLGVLTEKMPDWGKTFWQHVDVAKKLHHIRRVIVLDHRDCGAYREFLGHAAPLSLEAETAEHRPYLTRLGARIRQHGLAAELGLMALDGTVETIS